MNGLQRHLALLSLLEEELLGLWTAVKLDVERKRVHRVEANVLEVVAASIVRRVVHPCRREA
eukprot:scaffold115263_cov69-Phaeocystis_antarctica.AAC.5